ncbi:Protein NCA1 [Vitis vinifera]|uniref:Protein NCA1 n=1 Tax=Vitis vinifera TaxID=29760 RepID=A0A438EBQ8_VITVI|nr:Protein NCA1 [Vitis vinifera]
MKASRRIRATGDADSAVTYFEESVDFLRKLPADDLEITHTLSVSLNKIGDLKYYDGDLEAARSYYSQSLDVRRNAIKDRSNVPSQGVNLRIPLLHRFYRKHSLKLDYTRGRCWGFQSLGSVTLTLEHRAGSKETAFSGGWGICGRGDELVLPCQQVDLGGVKNRSGNLQGEFIGSLARQWVVKNLSDVEDTLAVGL